MRRRPLIQLIVATQTVVAARPLLHRRIERCARMHLRRIIQLAEVSLERASGQPPVQPVGAAASSFDHPALRAAHCEARHWLGNRCYPLATNGPQRTRAGQVAARPRAWRELPALSKDSPCTVHGDAIMAIMATVS